MEEWKTIPGYANHEASNYGNIRSIDHYVPFHDVNTKSISKRLIIGRIRILESTKHGYLAVRLISKGKLLSVHRLIALSFIPNAEGHEMINHIDGNRKNNMVTNLEWCNGSHNIKHSFNIGRSRKWGANKGRVGLDECQVLTIKSLLSDKFTQRRIAEYFKVSASTINDIKKGKSWGHLVC